MLVGTRWLWWVMTGCAAAAGAAPKPKPDVASPSSALAPAPADATDQVCTTTPGSVEAPWLEHVARPAATTDGEHNGPFVGMSWIAARPHGFPAVSLDARAVAYWVGEEAAASPQPHYGRRVVVSDMAASEPDRTFRLLDHSEVLAALPRGEAPTPRAIRLSEERLHDLEVRVHERVASTNGWLRARRWAPMRLCLGDGSPSAMRAESLRISVVSSPNPGSTAITIHHEDGRLLARREEGPTTCTGQRRLVSVAVATEQQVAVVEVAEIPTDSCAVSNRVHTFRLGDGGGVAPKPTALTTPACESGRALTEGERASQLQRYERSELAVFRLSPSEPLNLRAGPGVGAPVVAPLPFLSEGLRHAGGACRVDGALWLEVEYGDRRGWVNERFVSPMGALEEVEAIAETPIGDFAAPTLAMLGRRLREALSRAHSKLAGAAVVVELVGHRERAGYGQLVLLLVPSAGDSIAGVEYVAHAVLDAGLWRLEALEQRHVCKRGSRDGHCL